MLYLTVLFLSGPSLGRARRLAWIKRPRRTPSLNRVKHQILKRLFMKIYPMIHHSRMTILLLKKGLLTPQALSTSPQAPSGLRNPPIQQSLLISQRPQFKPVMPRMMRLSLLALVAQSQAILSLCLNILPRKNLLPLAKASGMLI